MYRVSGVHLKQRTPQNFDVSWVKQKLHSSQALSHQQPQQRLGWGQGLQGHGFQVVAARIRSDAHLAASKRSSEARKLRGAKTRWRGTGTIWNHGDVSFLNIGNHRNANLRYSARKTRNTY